ncbi:hypothetical protein Q73A0000_01335 [Kaistella flava (ex Peng et al. 2021)]|uniref:Uncharacterized protein n=1 Tax=Kaistella flava (ex Peng et al. 2021) TaxID=2038776 RepID=A0A7M2Y626_9FLAO|nr:hypothetical protein [Kaistella flava (ex Peng et al. 2021)]QOW09085.1 hypothetical protein Q73A0000_01335 [Kaistella flava (ex Peng et al. 2021)]
MQNKFKTAIQKELERLKVKPLNVAFTKLSELPTYEGEFSENDVLIGVNKVLEMMGQEAIPPSVINYLDQAEGTKSVGKEI